MKVDALNTVWYPTDAQVRNFQQEVMRGWQLDSNDAISTYAFLKEGSGGLEPGVDRRTFQQPRNIGQDVSVLFYQAQKCNCAQLQPSAPTPNARSPVIHKCSGKGSECAPFIAIIQVRFI
jgi:hypothetical protein